MQNRTTENTSSGLATPGTRSSSVLPDLLSQASPVTPPRHDKASSEEVISYNYDIHHIEKGSITHHIASRMFLLMRTHSLIYTESTLTNEHGREHLISLLCRCSLCVVVVFLSSLSLSPLSSN